MQNIETRAVGLPFPILTRGIGHQHPWWNDAMDEFLAMVRGKDVEIDWLDNCFQQFADEPPSKTKQRRQIANVAAADRPRLLRRTLEAAPKAAEDTPSSRNIAKRKQDSQIASGESIKTASSSSAQPIKKIKSNTPNPSSRLNITSGTSSRGMDDNPPLHTSQHAVGPSSSGALSTANFGLSLLNNFDTLNKSLAAQPERALVGQTEASPARDPTSSIDWHPEHIKVKKERDDLASQLAKANEQLKDQETRLSELHRQLSPLMDAAHGMLQGLNAVDLQREKMRSAAINLLSQSNYAQQQAAAAPTSTGRGDPASTTRNPSLQGRSATEDGPDVARNGGRQETE